MHRIVDTAVLVTANETRDPAIIWCGVECARVLGEIKDSGSVAVDARWEIVREYTNNVSASGQPGPGDAFLRWLLSNVANPARVLQVPLTAHPDRGYAEFPDHAELATLDAADRKFVSVANVSGRPLSVARDRGWWNHRSALAEAGIALEILCPELLQQDAEGRRR